MFKSIGLPEIIIVGLILVVAFGSKKINKLARRLGESSKELAKVKKEYEKTVASGTNEDKKNDAKDDKESGEEKDKKDANDTKKKGDESKNT